MTSQQVSRTQDENILAEASRVPAMRMRFRWRNLFFKDLGLAGEEIGKPRKGRQGLISIARAQMFQRSWNGEAKKV